MATKTKNDEQAEPEAAETPAAPEVPAPTADDARPAWWNFDEDGDRVAGSFVNAGQGQTKQGRGTFVVLDVDGAGRRTIWLLQKVIFAAFRREVEARPDHELHVGERIEITRLGLRLSEESGREYMDFRVSFGDAYQPPQSELFGVQTAASPAPVDEPPELEERPDDDIPF
jgi:hypothetical protein